MPGDVTRILGIESSCDDTAAAVLDVRFARCQDAPIADVRSNIVWGQAALHADFGGVVPEIAARAHAERLDHCAAEALKTADVRLGELDAIAVTSGPGLIGGVLSGVMFAKGLAAGAGLPLIGVNHLAGHALTPRLTDGAAYPYLMLLVSGGHCQFLVVRGPDAFTRLGGTIDDAPGEAFDKVAKLLGLGYPGGPEIERAARGGDPLAYKFPRPLLDREGCDLSFSGLKTAVLRALEQLMGAQGGEISTQQLSDLCASFQAAVADVLARKTARALAAFEAEFGTPPLLAVAGGVAANGTLRAALEAVAAQAGARFLAPPLAYCTDNAAMIAYVGAERAALGLYDDLSLTARPRWPLDPAAAPLLGAGKRGVKA